MTTSFVESEVLIPERVDERLPRTDGVTHADGYDPHAPSAAAPSKGGNT